VGYWRFYGYIPRLFGIAMAFDGMVGCAYHRYGFMVYDVGKAHAMALESDGELIGYIARRSDTCFSITRLSRIDQDQWSFASVEMSSNNSDIP